MAIEAYFASGTRARLLENEFLIRLEGQLLVGDRSRHLFKTENVRSRILLLRVGIMKGSRLMITDYAPESTYPFPYGLEIGLRLRIPVMPIFDKLGGDKKKALPYQSKKREGGCWRSPAMNDIGVHESGLLFDSIIYMLERVDHLFPHIYKLHPSLIFVGATLYPGVTAFFSRKSFEIPYVVYVAWGELVYLIQDATVSRIAGQIFRDAVVLIVDYEMTRDLLALFGVELGKIRIVNPGIEEQFFLPSVLKTNTIKHIWPSNKPVLFCIFRHDPGPRLAVLCETVQRLRSFYPQLCCLILGQGKANVDGIREAINTGGLQSCFRCGELTGTKDIAGLFQHCDLFLFLEPSEFDEVNLDLIKAGAASKAVVGRRGDIPVEMIQDGVTGLTADVDNPADLCGKLHRLLEDRSLREKIERLGRRWAANFIWSKQISQVENVLQLTIIQPDEGKHTGKFNLL